MLDTAVVVAIMCIWLLLLMNVILICGGYVYYTECEKKKIELTKNYPKVSIMVPAHNEGKVIVKTVLSLLDLNYPHDKYEIIVINDNSTDNSAELLGNIQKDNPTRRLTIINTDNVVGGKGKSNALNIGFKTCDGEYIVIYDADNTPEKDALLYLVSEIEANDKYGAVIGKFRTRNRDASLLTRFINVETLSFQWMAQAGRWKLFKLCTIPGTNFIIRRSIIEKMGGWDVKAIAEDTEISFRIYMMGYLIKFLPQAVTWEQEPQTLKVWFKQRTRWVKGNIYVLIKNMPLLFKKEAKKVRFDILYFLSIYFLLLTSLILSDVILILNLIGYVHLTISGFGNTLWIMAIILFVLGTYVSLTTEKGEMNLSNLGIIILMYFVYGKMWMVVAFYGLVMYIEDVVLKKEIKWYKTERY
jgi:cellulose synthase/poly-beta-1,6-N-acetylglucosamine synthase-like glycosyltransferase